VRGRRVGSGPGRAADAGGTSSPRSSPPRWAERLIGALLPASDREELLGDLAEIRADVAGTRGAARADREWWRLAVTTLWWRRFRSWKGQTWRAAMLASASIGSGGGPLRPRPRGAGLKELWRDASLAWRAVLRRPVQSGSVVATLALAIGLNTGTFSVVNAVVLRPLPYPEPDRLVGLFQATREAPAMRGRSSEPNFRDWRALSRSFEAMVSYRNSAPVLTGLGEPEVVTGGRVSEDFFRVIGRPLLRGRSFRRDEIGARAPDLVIVSEEFWRERLDSDPAVLGRALVLNDRPHAVIGVAEAGIDFPASARIWVNEGVDVEACGRGCVTFDVLGRLAEGVSIDDARRDLASVASRIDEMERDDGGRAVNVVALEELLIGDVRRGLLVLLGAVGLVLLIACANVANLLLAGAVARRHEIAVRGALGAGRGRIVRQLLAESLLLAGVGSVLGLALAHASVRAVRVWAADSIPRLADASVDGAVLLFTLVVLVDAALLFGLAPALTLGRIQPARVLASSRGRVGDTRGAGLGRAALITVQVGLSVALLAGTTLLVRTLSELQRVDLGFEPDRVEGVYLSLPAARYDEAGAVAFFAELRRRLAALPGVESVGGIAGLPLSGLNYGTSFEPLDGALDPDVEATSLMRPVLPGYFETIGIPTLEGRAFVASDTRDAERVVVVSRTLAEQIWPGESALGKRIDVHASTGFPEDAPRTVIGVVGNVRSLELTQFAEREMYMPQAQTGTAQMTMLVRLARGRGSVQREAREILRALDPAVPMRRAGPVSEQVAERMFATRFYSTLLTVFTAFAIALATLGLWGVVSYQVAQRRREVGVRMAIGARARDVVELFAWQGLRPALIGLAIGLAAAAAGTDLIVALLYNTSPSDIRIWFGVAAGMVLVTVAATLVPATRAARVPPAEVLRAE